MFTSKVSSRGALQEFEREEYENKERVFTSKKPFLHLNIFVYESPIDNNVRVRFLVDY